MTNFAINLKKYLDERNISLHKFAEMSGFKFTTFYDFMKSDNPLLANVLKIVDYLGTSMDYFEGKTTKFKCNAKKDYKFDLYTRVKQIMAQTNTTFFKLAADLKMSRTNLTRWRDGDAPKYITIVNIANYFNMSIDEFVGRV
ncbi:MAG: helix-turn-helix transcriptional regulator [Clostridiales bacterium]|nr:helix-turn-helix transcriptional regulator [Clostridiales bacterium]